MNERKQIGRMLHGTMKALMGRLAIHFERASIPLSVEQFIILRIVFSHERMIQQELAELLRKDKSAVLRQINALQDRHLLARIPDAEDKRRNHVVITKQGMEMLERAGEIHTVVIDEMLDGVDDAEYATFMKVMLTIQSNADKLGSCESQLNQEK